MMQENQLNLTYYQIQNINTICKKVMNNNTAREIGNSLPMLRQYKIILKKEYNCNISLRSKVQQN